MADQFIVYITGLSWMGVELLEHTEFTLKPKLDFAIYIHTPTGT